MAIEPVAPNAVDGAVGSQAKAAQERQQRNQDEIAAIKSRIDEQIEIVSRLAIPDHIKAELLGRLRGARDSGNPASMVSVLINVQTEVKGEVSYAEVKDTITEQIFSEYSFDAEAKKRVIARSNVIYFDDPKSVSAFAEAFADPDKSPYHRKMEVEAIKTVVASPEMREKMEEYNRASPEARLRANSNVDQARDDFKKVIKETKNPELKAVMEEAKEVGAEHHRPMQDIARKAIKGGMSEKEEKEVVEKARTETKAWWSAVKSNVGYGLEKATEAERDLLKNKSPDQIASLSREARKKKEVDLLPEDKAAMHVMTMAQVRTALTAIADNTVAIDLELSTGKTLAQRAEIGMSILEKKYGPPQSKEHAAALRSAVSSILETSDKKNQKVALADDLVGPEDAKFFRQAYAGSDWGKSFDTAVKHMSTGAEAMKKGDVVEAADAAHKTGLGTKNKIVEKITSLGASLGVSKEDAEKVGQAVGGTVTSTLTAGAVKIIAAKDTISDLSVTDNLRRSATAVADATGLSSVMAKAKELVSSTPPMAAAEVVDKATPPPSQADLPKQAPKITRDMIR